MGFTGPWPASAPHGPPGGAGTKLPEPNWSIGAPVLARAWGEPSPSRKTSNCEPVGWQDVAEFCGREVVA